EDFHRAPGSPLDDASALVSQLLGRAYEDPEGARRELSALRGDRSYGYVLLLLCQRAIATLTKNPGAGLTLASTIREESLHAEGSLPEKDRIVAEACLVAGYALTCLGRMNEARASFAEARARLASLPQNEFSLA